MSFRFFWLLYVFEKDILGIFEEASRKWNVNLVKSQENMLIKKFVILFVHWWKNIFRIPDLVKDPEAEAAFEALRGLVEASLQQEFEAQQAQKKESKKRKNTAKKSTTSLAKAGKRATARKSTTSDPNERGQFSYYGLPEDPLNFNDISTRMSIGGMEITLNASKLAGMVNLKPVVRIKDCEDD